MQREIISRESFDARQKRDDVGDFADVEGDVQIPSSAVDIVVFEYLAERFARVRDCHSAHSK